MAKLTFFSRQYPGEVFTVEELDEGQYQTVYPAQLAERGAIYQTASDALEALKRDWTELGIVTVKDVR